MLEVTLVTAFTSPFKGVVAAKVVLQAMGNNLLLLFGQTTELFANVQLVPFLSFFPIQLLAL